MLQLKYFKGLWKHFLVFICTNSVLCDNIVSWSKKFSSDTLYLSLATLAWWKLLLCGYVFAIEHWYLLSIAWLKASLVFPSFLLWNSYIYFTLESSLFSQCHYLSSDSEMLRYAFAELEESRGAIQVTKFDLLVSTYWPFS